LLREVVSKTAFSRLSSFWKGASYTFEKIDLKGNSGVVASRFQPSSGDSLVLEYYIQKKGGQWLIYDVAFEGVRYSVNIHEQIDSFLKEKSFPGLLEKLRKRRDDIDSGKKRG
jgi:ABC-type transporter MlaC component